MIQASYFHSLFTIVITILLSSPIAVSFAEPVDTSDNRTYEEPISDLIQEPKNDPALAGIDPDLSPKPLDPNIHSMIQKVIDLSAQGKIEEARYVLSSVPPNDPNYAYALHELGNALSNLGEYKEAFEAYDNATKVKPSYYYSWYNKGNMLSQLGDQEKNYSRYEEAIKMYDEALKINPNYYLAWYNKGNMLSELGDYENSNFTKYEEALKAYDNTLKIEPDYYFAWYNRGNILAKLADIRQDSSLIEKAINMYNKTVTLNSTYYFAWYNMANEFSDLSVVQSDPSLVGSAIDAYMKVLDITPDYEFAWNNLGQAYVQNENYTGAIYAYTQAIRINPEFMLPYLNLGVILSHQKHYPEAIAEFNRIIDNATIYNEPLEFLVSSELRASAYYQKGIALKNMGLIEEAMDSLENARKIDPTFYSTVNMQGTLLNYQGKYQDAQKKFDEALEHAKDYNYTLYNKNEIIHDLVDIHNNKGAVSVNVGNPQQAIAQYDIAIRLSEENSLPGDLATIKKNRENASYYYYSQWVGFPVALAIGFGTWYISKITLHKTTKALFNAQRIPILHLIFQRKPFKSNEYFMVPFSDTKKSLTSAIIIVIASYAFLIGYTDDLAGYLGSTPSTPEEQDLHYLKASGSHEAYAADSMLRTRAEAIVAAIIPHLEVFRISAWVLTLLLVAFVALPIDVIESSKVRLYIKSKNIVISPNSAYTVLKFGIGFTTLFSLYSIFQKNTAGAFTHSALTIALTLLPLIPLFILHLMKTQNQAVIEFRDYLRRSGIGEKSLEPIEKQNKSEDGSLPPKQTDID